MLDLLVRVGDVAWRAAGRHDELVMMRGGRGGLLPWTLLAPCLLGGFDESGPLSSVLIGSGTTGFRTLAWLPQTVRYPAVAVSGGEVYLFGGLQAGGEHTGTFTPLIQQVDPATGTARIAGRLPYPVAHAKAVVLDGQVLGESRPACHTPSRARMGDNVLCLSFSYTGSIRGRATTTITRTSLRAIN